MVEATNLKEVYLRLLQDMLDALSPRQEQLTLTYSKAKANLTEAEGNFYHPRDLKKVKGIGDTIIKRLESKLETYCTENNIPFPAYELSNEGTRKRKAISLREGTTGEQDLNTDTEKKPKKLRKYIPKKRSGGYAILLALLEVGGTNRGFTKDRIIEVAQKYTDSSMNSNFATKEFHSSWMSISSLKKHSLVLEQGRPKMYFLTSIGAELANTLKTADTITFPDDKYSSRPNTANLINTENELTANLSELMRLEQGIKRRNSNTFNSSFADVTFQTKSPNDISTPGENRNMIRSPMLHYQNLLDNSLTPTKNKKDSHVHNIEEKLTHINRKRFQGISYEIWPKGTYEIYPIIDNREVKSQQDRDFFSNSLARKGVKSEIRQLSLGDIIWVAKNNKTGFHCVLNTIIERKRLDDLAGSIKDNRFMEQKNRLEKSGCTYKYYLIEETMSGNLGTMVEALKTALWLILVYYKFSIIRTNNSDQTVDKLHALHSVLVDSYSKKDLLVMYPNDLRDQDDYRKVLEKFRLEFSNRTSIECCQTLECFQEVMGKNELRTIGELTIQVLLYIKGVSLEKALAIQSVFPTLNHILNAYRNCVSEQEAKLLIFTKLGEAPGNKKITKSLSEKIAEAFI